MIDGSTAHVIIKNSHNRFDPNLIISHTARCSPILSKAPVNRFKQYLLFDIERVIQEQLDSARKPNTPHQRFCTSVPLLIEFLCQLYARPLFKGFHGFWSVEEFQRSLERTAQILQDWPPGNPRRPFVLEKGEEKRPSSVLLIIAAEAYSAMEELTPALLTKNMESDRRTRDILYFHPTLPLNGWMFSNTLQTVSQFDKVRLCPYCEKLTEESLYTYIFHTVGRYKRCNEHPGKEISGTRLPAKHIYMFHFENLYEDWAFKPASLEFYSKVETFLHSY
ncbi:hypothetical protein EYR41_002283 [Orbilia oligospora]|uniref:Uncharacterized protein n=1 Tax=Orbilia oligospora TaxID=2813651 RepID=A0A8H2DQV1_ORBOL|nr:hypothetical protein TWF128_008823 [Orbilia oligospora]KAF3278047.1 hypothetical protein TWF132_001304 [Orbilia oligospora]TGJ62304.1 hypothetical protein EYR41_002283 [Orbilia oligospora]